MVVLSRSNAPHYAWGAGCDGWRLLDGADLSVIEERIPPKTGEAAHRHRVARQLFFVLDGALRIDRGEDRHVLGPGESLEMPPATSHLVWNDTDADVRFLVISAPSTRDDRENLASTATA
jgi:mannose-6-phosphate isomerase-like protein (cupin superfamily)